MVTPQNAQKLKHQAQYGNCFTIYKTKIWQTFILFWTDYRTYGVPTIRTDLHAPRIKRVCDNKNYGDESNAYGLVNPSIFSRCNVHDKDFLLPRTPEQVCINVAHT